MTDLVMPTAIILAGGRGTRLSSVVRDVPKPMADVNGRPFLYYQLLHLKREGVRRVVLSVGYLADVIAAYFGDGSELGLEIRYAREDSPLGTAGALRNALPLMDRACLVFNGDTYQPLSLEPLVAAHRDRVAEMTVVVTPVLSTGDYGSIAFDAAGRIQSFAEKLPGVGYVNAGCYYLDASLLTNLPLDRPTSLEIEAIPSWIAAGHRCFAWETGTRFFDIGTPERYRAFQEEIRTLEQ